MKKNKYLVFVSIGFELIGLLVVAIWFGRFLTEKGYGGTAAEAFCILAAFLIWFISLMMKLKNLQKK